jgi:CTD kinase subunit beta
MRLKIVMRESEHAPRPRPALDSADLNALYDGDGLPLIGQTVGTVRFLFGPPGIVGLGI